jgi:hypothetical protein
MGLLGCAVVAGGTVLVVVIVAFMIKRALSRAANRALGEVGGLGRGIAGQAAGVALRIGEKELAKGFQSFKAHINHEMLTSDPKKMELAVTKVAQKHRGLITPANVMHELEVEEQLARDTLQRLVRQEVCRLQDDDKELYAFPGFMEKRKVKVCDYCDSVFEPDEAERTCLACGAELKEATTV